MANGRLRYHGWVSCVSHKRVSRVKFGAEQIAGPEAPIWSESSVEPDRGDLVGLGVQRRSLATDSPSSEVKNSKGHIDLLHEDHRSDHRSRDQTDGAILPFGLSRPMLPCPRATAPGEAPPKQVSQDLPDANFGFRSLPRWGDLPICSYPASAGQPKLLSFTYQTC